MAEVPRPGSKGEQGMFALDKYEGLNTKAGRSAIKDQEVSWSMNMMPIGEGNMRSLRSNGATLYTAPGGTQVIYYYCFNIGPTDYIAVFLDDGRADQVNLTTLSITHISATPGTFYNGTALPCVAQYGSTGIVIVAKFAISPGASGYWAWDGTLYGAGSAAPAWLTGSTPTTMPSGISGNAVELYQSRVWIEFGPVVSFSAPTNGAVFGSGGAGSFQSTDSFLRKTFVAMRQSNGFLYLLGDSSINVISNVQTGGTPAITTFNNNNIEPQVSTPWPGTVQAFGRQIVFANTSGVYSLFGGTAEKVSDALDGVFATADFLGLTPTAAVATIYGIRCYIIVIKSLDPISGTSKPQMFCWDGKKWFPATQDNTVSLLATQEISSSLTAIGSDGTHIFPIFQTASATLPKVVRSKLWSGKSGYITTKQGMRIYAQAFDAAGAGIDINAQIDTESQFAAITLSLGSPINFVNNSGGLIQFQNNSFGNISFQSSGLAVRGRDLPGVYGLLLGFTINSFSPDFTLVSTSMLYQEYAPLG